MEGFHWPAYSDVTLTIDDPNVEGEVNYTETHTVDKQGQTTFLVENPKPFIIAAGQELTLSGGGYTKSHTIFDIGFSSYDSALETVSGSGNPGLIEVVAVNGEARSTVNTEVNELRVWAANFLGLIDIEPGVYGWVYHYDEEGDYTQVYWRIYDPYIRVYLNANRIFDSDSHLIRPLTFQLTDPETPEPVDYTSSGEFNYSQVVFSLTDFILRPGQIVSLSNQGITKTHEIRDIAITALYKESDLITGTADQGVKCRYQPGRPAHRLAAKSL